MRNIIITAAIISAFASSTAFAADSNASSQGEEKAYCKGLINSDT